MRWSLAGPLLALALVACSDATGVTTDKLDVVAAAEGLRLTSQSDADLFYGAVDPESFALWAGPEGVTMCQDPACPHLSPHGTATVAWQDVVGWSEATTRVTVYWWRVVPDGDGHWRLSESLVRSREVAVP